MQMYTPAQWVLFFYIYCLIGWIWESTYVSVCTRKLVNRGFLKGPFLPIYGSGAICILIVTIPFRGSVWQMALVGMAAATLLEYVTGAVMERLFRVRYWDYTGKFLNVNGYICLSSTLCWGVMTVLLVKVFHIHIEKLVLSVDENYISGLVLLITPCITADFVTSFHAAIHLRELLIQNERVRAELLRLAQKKQELENAVQEAGEKMREKVREQISGEMQELLIRIGEQREKLRIPSADSVRGLLKRNPRAVSHKHREAFAELRQNILEKIDEIRK